MEYAHAHEVGGSVGAAEKVVAAVLRTVGRIQSVVDLGGGTGAWCRAFKASGVERVTCLDHPVAKSDGLLINEDEFRGVDLTREDPDPVPSDLAVSLEFAEHMPSSRAEWVVEFLTRSAPVVLFSAAVPKQGGIGHVNEQWPAFWADLFARRGFSQLDVIRPLIIGDRTIQYWYRQNMFLYAADTERFSGLQPLLPAEFVCIHKSIAKYLGQPSLRTILHSFGPALSSAVSSRLPWRNNRRSGNDA